MKFRVTASIIIAMAAGVWAQLLPSQKNDPPVNLNLPLDTSTDLDSDTLAENPEKVHTQEGSLGHTGEANTAQSSTENSSKKTAVHTGICATGIALSTILGGNNYIGCRLP